MTADSSENETESRVQDRYSTEVRNIGGQDGDPSGVREGVEAGRIWEDGNGRERKRDAGSGNGDLNNGFSDSSDLNGELKESRKNVQKATDMDIDAEVQGRHEKENCRLTRDRRNLETAKSSEDDRDEETEDDFEEGDGATAEVVSKHHTPPSHPQEQSGRADLSQHEQQQEREPLPQSAPVATAGWESFIPQKRLRVLLAEDDDSTRHVVGALLRNCGYEVTPAANGMQAWEILEDPNKQFDLVLTDVVMPCLSGVGLLTKIMSREAGKRLPVIMMSSHDSLDIVFRCLSKGAVDFLVKPVRKNELKNLWQHVWRCQSSSGSGSGGSGSGTGKGTQPKSRVGSGNNSGSNDGSEDGSSGLNVWGGSDNGSGTQTVAVHVQTREKQKRDREEGQATSLQKASDDQMGHDLEMATKRPGSAELLQAEQGNKHNESSALNRDSPSSSDRNDGEQMEEGYNSGSANSGASAKAIDLIGGIACHNNEDVKEGDDSDGGEGSDRGASNSPVMNDKYASGSSLPTLELSLKRSRVPGEDDVDFEQRRVVRQSGGSAFSRYSTSGVIIQQHHPSGNPLGFGGYPMGASYSLASGQSCLDTSKTGQLHLAAPLDRCGSSLGSGEASTLANHPHHPQNGNGQDMGSGVVGTSGQDGYASRQAKDEAVSVSPVSGTGIPMSRPGVPPPPGVMYDGVSTAYGPPMHSPFYSHPGAPPWAAGPAHKSNRGKVFDHPPFRDHGAHVSHHHPHHHQTHHPQHHHHHHHSHMPQTSLLSKPDDQTVINQGSGAPHCGSSSMPDGNTGQSGSSNGYGSNGNGNGSVNGSASGSNNMSNQNGQSGVPLSASCNGVSVGNNGDSGSGNAVTPNGGIVDTEQNRYARREAALNKFKQKRKERCFEKKVRYQSRKRLAEQRPRVRGQFVRQTVYDVNTGEAVE